MYHRTIKKFLVLDVAGLLVWVTSPANAGGLCGITPALFNAKAVRAELETGFITRKWIQGSIHKLIQGSTRRQIQGSNRRQIQGSTPKQILDLILAQHYVIWGLAEIAQRGNSQITFQALGFEPTWWRPEGIASHIDIA